MKILLIAPPSSMSNPVLPLGLAFLAASLRKNRWKVQVLDAWAEQLTVAEVAHRVEVLAPDVVGVSIMSPNLLLAMQTIAQIRKISNAVIVVGGSHPSALPEQCLQDYPAIDFVVQGEGDETFVSLLERIRDQSTDFSGIPGIHYRRQGAILSTGGAGFIKDLNLLEFPARDLFPLSRYKTHPPYGKQNPYMNMITSRGCPFQCTYCSSSVSGRRYRGMSPQRMVEEIEFIVGCYGVREIHFYDDDFTMNQKRIAQFCDLIVAKGIVISWSCTTRVDLVSVELLQKMRASGCWLISYGVESANAAILKQIKKGYDLAQVEQAFLLTRQAKIRTVAYLMAGLPGETPETIRETAAFSLRLDPDFVSWGIHTLFPGSPMFAEAMLKQPDLITSYHTISSHPDARNLGSPYVAGQYAIYENDLTREELTEFVKEANRLFYLRFSYAIRILFKMRSFYEFKYYIMAGITTIRWLTARKEHIHRP
ncbi:MAG: cobalamin-dependent protein [Magnetococcales bacterium]|nr:cobalamin-dependent protein [Magnetococcales bacterium]